MRPNALEKTELPRIIIRVRRFQEGMVQVKVVDNGRGITPEEQRNLFRPFYTSKAGGTGLGLVIVKKMLAKMNSTVRVDSQPGNGTTVTMILPKLRSVSMGSHKKRLVVIDDDRLLCDTIRHLFETQDLDVAAAHSGNEGLRLCEAGPADVVLLDQKLPDANGIDFCGPILGCCEQTKIIFITAYPRFEDAVQAIKAGAYDYLSKPFRAGSTAPGGAKGIEDTRPRAV